MRGPSIMMVLDETPAQHAAVHEFLRIAFGSDAEADLVDDLRASGDVAAAFLTVDARGISGYVMFCRLKAVIGGRNVPAVALAPLAVRADCRKCGLGARLVAAGLARCREAGQELAVVLGDPAYYRRFGFSVEAARQLRSPFSGPHLQVLVLQPDRLASGPGRITYPRPFDRFAE